MNDFVRNEFTDALNEYRLSMRITSSDPAWNAGCDALRYQMMMATVSTIMGELETSKQQFARTLFQQLPAPPQPLQVEHPYSTDELLDQVDWRALKKAAAE